MKICKKCQVDKSLDLFHRDKGRKDGRMDFCKDCRRVEDKARYQENLEANRLKSLSYYHRNKDKVRAKQRIYWLENRDKLKTAAKVYRLHNKDRLKQIEKLWREKNSDRVRLVSKNYRNKNLEKIRLRDNRAWHRRKARKLGNGFEQYSVNKVLAKYGTICHICNQQIDLSAARKAGLPGWEKGLQLDHLIPLSKGGPDTLDNVRPSHGKCNLVKSSRIQ